MLRIAVTTPKGQTSQIECTIDSCSIGKGSDNLIALQGWTVAKKHAAVTRRPEGVFVEDLGSSSGTEVNGKKVSRHGPLSSSDKIVIAGYTLQVLDLDVPAPAVAPAQTSAPAHAANGAGGMAGNGAAVPPTSPAPAAPAHAPEPEPAPKKNAAEHDAMIAQLKRIHAKLIKQMDLRRIDVSRQTEEELRVNTRALLEEIVGADTEIPPGMDKAAIVKRVLDEVVGLGPLEDLLADEAVTEIMVNRFNEIFIERSGKLQQSEVTFTSDQAVVQAIERIVAPLGR